MDLCSNNVDTKFRENRSAS